MNVSMRSVALTSVLAPLAWLPVTAVTAEAPTANLTSGPSAPPPAAAPFAGDTAKQHQAAWAAYLHVPVEMTNSIGMRLVLIPPGEFDMGTSDANVQRELEAGRQAKPPVHAFYPSRVMVEGPQHRVRITRAFYLGACEVTQSEYQQVMGVNPSSFSSSATGTPPKKARGKNTSRHPVETVLWQESSQFSKLLSALPTEASTHRSYRLPTEAEWEYSCRAGTTTRWFCGDDKAGLLDYAWFMDNSDGMTHSVGEKKANAWGLFDMHGNVFEWCADRHNAEGYGQPSHVDPLGPTEGIYHVVRGGSWDRYALGCRSAYRGIAGHAPWPPKAPIIGFRVVCEISAR